MPPCQPLTAILLREQRHKRVDNFLHECHGGSGQQSHTCFGPPPRGDILSEEDRRKHAAAGIAECPRNVMLIQNGTMPVPDVIPRIRGWH